MTAKAQKKKYKTLGKALPFFRRVEDYAVSVICVGLLIAVLFFAGCILIVLFKAVVHDKWCIDFSADGVENMLLFWRGYAPLLRAFFYSSTLFVACHTLIKYIDVETSRSLSEIRSKLNEEPKKLIHDHFLNPGDKTDIKGNLGGSIEGLKSKDGTVDFTAVEVYDYLGTLELGAIMLHRGIISEKEFFDQFGYRYIYIGKSALMKLIEHDAHFYKPLLYAMEVAHRHNRPSGIMADRAGNQATPSPVSPLLVTTVTPQSQTPVKKATEKGEKKDRKAKRRKKK